MSVKTQIADVTCETTDILDCAITTDQLGPCAVTTAKIKLLNIDSTVIAANAVTTNKFAMSLGKWFVGKYTSDGTDTIAVTLTMTAACSIIRAVLRTTTKSCAGSTITLEDSGGIAMLAVRAESGISTHVGPCKTAGESLLKLAAGAELRLKHDQALTSGAGTYWIQYITTPTK